MVFDTGGARIYGAVSFQSLLAVRNFTVLQLKRLVIFTALLTDKQRFISEYG
jgi:hypothetical protein